jgi:hypothetical protein
MKIPLAKPVFDFSGKVIAVSEEMMKAETETAFLNFFRHPWHTDGDNGKLRSIGKTREKLDMPIKTTLFKRPQTKPLFSDHTQKVTKNNKKQQKTTNFYEQEPASYYSNY